MVNVNLTIRDSRGNSRPFRLTETQWKQLIDSKSAAWKEEIHDTKSEVVFSAVVERTGDKQDQIVFRMTPRFKTFKEGKDINGDITLEIPYQSWLQIAEEMAALAPGKVSRAKEK